MLDGCRGESFFTSMPPGAVARIFELFPRAYNGSEIGEMEMGSLCRCGIFMGSMYLLFGHY